MYRLLIVDDEEIITDSLYEVFQQLMPDSLDVCKSYSAKEAIYWLSRTRFDIVLTDIRMPGMDGLELSEHIQMYWPRCKIVFLTGYSEFEYVYKAIQMPNVSYLLKTEGYDKVTETVEGVIRQIQQENQLSEWLQQSREQNYAYEFMAQSDYFRHLLQDSAVFCEDEALLVREFRKLKIGLDPTKPVVLVLGHLSYPEGSSYSDRSDILRTSRMIWNSYLADKTRQIGIVDKHEDVLWFLQPSPEWEQKIGRHLTRYLEGTLELIQEACQHSLALTVAFTISGASCGWRSMTPQYERLRQLQQMKIGDNIAVIITDRADPLDTADLTEAGRIKQKTEIMAAHLEAGRKEKFFEIFAELADYMRLSSAIAQRTLEAYYSIALVLLSQINRWGMARDIEDYGKLMRLEEHASVQEAVRYLAQIAERIFEIRRSEEREEDASVIDRICLYINEHLSEDLSLVRLAELNFFNPSYLSRLFKQERGINLSEYIDDCRAKKAKELLRDGELKVREVGLSVGYEAAHSFTRFFKKATGMTPQEYRDSLMKAHDL